MALHQLRRGQGHARVADEGPHYSRVESGALIASWVRPRPSRPVIRSGAGY